MLVLKKKDKQEREECVNQCENFRREKDDFINYYGNVLEAFVKQQNNPEDKKKEKLKVE